MRSTRDNDPLGRSLLDHGRGATQYSVTIRTMRSETMLQQRLVASTAWWAAVNVEIVSAPNTRTSKKANVADVSQGLT